MNVAASQLITSEGCRHVIGAGATGRQVTSNGEATTFGDGAGVTSVMGGIASRYLLLLIWAAAAKAQTSTDVCAAWTGTSTGTQRIVGGTAASIAMPWLAVLHPAGTPPSSSICGATLVSKRHVVTAAHCLHALDEDRLRPAITLGVLNRCLRREATRQSPAVATAVSHPDYKSSGDLYDIAVITLAEDAEARFTPACLPPPLEENRRGRGVEDEGRWAMVAGFGQTKEGDEDSVACRLQCAGVRVLKDAECARTALPRPVATAPTLLCAGVKGGGVDSCQGDSGGGLIVTENNPACKNVLIGVVAFGYGCGQPLAPGLYTRVAAYVPWLNRQMGSGGASDVAPSTTAAPASASTTQRPATSSGGGSGGGGRLPFPPPPHRPPRGPFFIIFRRDGRTVAFQNPFTAP